MTWLLPPPKNYIGLIDTQPNDESQPTLAIGYKTSFMTSLPSPPISLLLIEQNGRVSVNSLDRVIDNTRLRFNGAPETINNIGVKLYKAARGHIQLYKDNTRVIGPESIFNIEYKPGDRILIVDSGKYIIHYIASIESNSELILTTPWTGESGGRPTHFNYGDGKLVIIPDDYADITESRRCNDVVCDNLSGGWSDWVDSGSCDKTCGGGIREQVRSCTNPLPGTNGADCVGSATQFISCNEQACPIDGGWSEWWNSGPCINGNVAQTRSCSNPSPSYGGAECIGSNIQYTPCNTIQASTSNDVGTWSNWFNWSNCSKPCGSGIQTRTRICFKQASNVMGPVYVNGLSVTGRDTKFTSITTPAHLLFVESNGNLLKGHVTEENIISDISFKTSWGINPTTSSNEEMSMIIQEPGSLLLTNGSTVVVGQNSTFLKSYKPGSNILVNLGSAYSHNTVIEVIDDNHMTLKQLWINETGSYSGGFNYSIFDATCEGNRLEEIACNIQECPINGGWSDWVDSGSCSKECGGGTGKRTRTCNNPIPESGGKYCVGNADQYYVCNTNPCPSINGGWSEWVNSGACDKECGGKLTQVRSCTNPTPEHGGKDCVGDPMQFLPCNGICSTDLLKTDTDLLKTNHYSNMNVVLIFILLLTFVVISVIVITLKYSSISEANTTSTNI
jgi:hypothetical protein